MINNVVLVSGVQQSDSFIHIHVSILFNASPSQVEFPDTWNFTVLWLMALFLLLNNFSLIFQVCINANKLSSFS